MSSQYWVTEPDAEIQIRMGTGYASKPAKTVMDVFKETVTKHGGEPALGLKRAAKVGGLVPENWKIWTYKEYYDDCIAFAKTLLFLKVDKHKIVNIIGFNSPEWFIADVGCMFAGCIASGVYTTNTSDACQYVLSHSKGEVLVCEDNKQLKKYADRDPKV